MTRPECTSTSSPLLDEAEQRLIEAVERALRDTEADHAMLRQRVRNRAEKYRELARRRRFGGAAASHADAGRLQALFEELVERLEALEHGSEHDGSE